MKTIFSIIILLSILCACDKHENPLENSTIESLTKRTRIAETPHFSFDSITNPENWRTYQSLKEMLDACQIPTDILSKIPTDELVRICMDYPLSVNYIAYDDKLKGIKAIMDGFNGFAELQKRSDAAEELISFYEKIDIDAIAEKASANNAKTTLSRHNLNLVHVGFIENILRP